jgi:hypothetical protein
VLLAVTLAVSAAAAGGAVSWTSAILVGALALAAVLISLLGLAGDYVQRIYRQSSGRPFFLVRRVHEAATAADDRTERSTTSERPPQAIAT